MIEQTATVLGVADGAALVEVTRQAGCSACAQGDGCGTAVLGRLFAGRAAARVRIVDPLGLTPGERVLIGVRDQTLVRASLAAYLLPVLLLVGAAGLAEQLTIGAIGSALLGLGGLVLGLWLAGLITGGSGAAARFRPILLRRLDQLQPVAREPLHPSVGG
ncbi:MAG: Fis family transcriptional regulator [Chromatiaceae bacterium]|nr:MAG: Fis family transcriptional regulator [Chromatiaceae bacterium]